MKRPWLALAPLTALALVACREAESAPLYQAIPVVERNIVVSASAAGSIEPVLTVDVKSKASGEIMDLRVDVGDDIRQGQLIALIDRRNPENTLAQAQADLEVAEAQLQNATSQLKRSETLYETQSISEQEFEQARLSYANANAAVVRAKVNLQNARDALEDTRVLSPITGTIIQKSVERGQVISSPTRDVGGGTVLMQMANLDTVQVRSLVDETDIGKIEAGLRATITVDAYPQRPFTGAVLKIEPQATVQQNVTMFPVLVRIDNREGLLKPGMNAEVEVHIGRADSVLAVPVAALRTERDVASAAQVLGLDPDDVQQRLAEARQRPPAEGAANGAAAPDSATRDGATPGVMQFGGREVRLPQGVTEQQVRTIMAKMRDQGRDALSAAERATLQQVRQQSGFGRPGAGGAATPRRNTQAFGGTSAVFVLRDGRPHPVEIRTGLTDLDYAAVTGGGLSAGDTVLVLPSAGLIQAQEEFRSRIQERSGLPGVSNQGSGGRR